MCLIFLIQRRFVFLNAFGQPNAAVINVKSIHSAKMLLHACWSLTGISVFYFYGI